MYVILRHEFHEAAVCTVHVFTLADTHRIMSSFAPTSSDASGRSGSAYEEFNKAGAEFFQGEYSSRDLM